MAFIYVITNDINGKQYVGKTNSSIEERFKKHISDSKKQHCEKRPLYTAMNKYGVEHFSIEVLEECNVEDSSEKEMYWIQQLETYGDTGYNATLGGDSKHYYNYNELANAYLKLGTIQKVCEEYHCDKHTVHTACKEKGVRIAQLHEPRKVAMLDKETLETLKIFPSIADAARELTGRNRAGNHITEVCRGKNQTAYGYRWKYVD